LNPLLSCFHCVFIAHCFAFLALEALLSLLSSLAGLLLGKQGVWFIKLLDSLVLTQEFAVRVSLAEEAFLSLEACTLRFLALAFIPLEGNRQWLVQL
jgi:hypothetical protein